MTDEIALDTTNEAGIVQEPVLLRETHVFVRVFLFRFVVASRVACLPQLADRQLVAVSDDIAQLTRVTNVSV